MIQKWSRAMRRPMYNPRPVPTMLSRKAAAVDKRAPTHQPMELPTKIPVKPSNLRIILRGCEIKDWLRAAHTQ